MSVRIELDERLPAEIESAALPILGRWADALLPTWCHSLRVAWDETEGEACAECVADHEYRRARITIGAAFLNRSDDKEEVLVHELLHVALMPMAAFCRDMCDEWQETEAFRAAAVLARHDFNERYEGAVCDLTRAVLALSR